MSMAVLMLISTNVISAMKIGTRVRVRAYGYGHPIWPRMCRTKEFMCPCV